MLKLADTRAPDDVMHLIAVQDAVLRYRLDVLDVAPDRIAAATTLLDMIDSGRLTANRRDVGVDRAGLHRRRRGRSVFHYFVRWLRLRRHDTGTGIWLGNCLGEQELNRRGLRAATG